MKLKKIFALLLTGLFLNNIILPYLCSEEISGISKSVLKGLSLTKIKIRVDLIVFPDKYGLTEEMLEAFLETEMKKRGVKKIYKSHSFENYKEFYPYFSVIISPNPESDDEDSFILRCCLYDKAYLARNRSIKFDAKIWDSVILFIPEGRFAKLAQLGATEYLLNLLKLTLNRFFEDYKASNS